MAEASPDEVGLARMEALRQNVKLSRPQTPKVWRWPVDSGPLILQSDPLVYLVTKWLISESTDEEIAQI
jgi:hypothetical protein